jgi:CspA family cold shock protein
MKTGTVKWFNGTKGYGFITPEEGEGARELFVHYSDIQMDGYRTLVQGQKVYYEFCDGAKGPHANQVRAVDAEVTVPERELEEAFV